MRGMQELAALAALTTLLRAAPPPSAEHPVSRSAREFSHALLAEADAHYGRRASGRTGARAASLEISEAVALYERAGFDPDSAEARWKLARALYFLGSYTGLDERGQRAVFERARQAGEAAIAIIAGRRRGAAAGGFDRRKLDSAGAAEVFRGDPDSAPSFFWTAVGWGQWSLASGKLDAARKGAASRIRDDCRTLIALDPAFEEGGGYRILGRLHDQAPRLPFVTAWVSRAEGLRLLRLAVAEAPRNFVNRQFLAEALERSGDRASALAIERSIAADLPTPDHLVEELAIQETARKNLASWKATISRQGLPADFSRILRTAGLSGSSSSISFAVFPVTGCVHSGAISASGVSTKRRSAIRGWGRVGSGPLRTRPRNSRMSRSISRGPFLKRGTRPISRSISFNAASRSSGAPSQAISATAL